ncbi:PhnD/SsuA/transferrin family substrate-binding protein [Alteromonas facilis]|uniref:PhnD/SsuA/transferrin family substrate-binding protein n=1 Tax=Alteromonas facilis TaxID=2048004 RepID=UPI000F5C5003|nr:PhnD/SsuA/transferrin family substrate-binding protein [Alteromonas facilis]
MSENPDKLTIYVTDKWLANAMLESLCGDEIVKKQFGNVLVTLGDNDFDTYRNISYGIADLALVKDNMVNAFVSDKVYGYRPIAQYPSYPAYFIGSTEKPLLSKEYFLGKRIGLLDYPSSRSGHIAPKTELQKLDIDESNSTILYFNSHQELREKLRNGDVDIIASYWDESDTQNFSINYRTEISSSITGSRWYLRRQDRNIDLICSIQKNIARVSDEHPSSYYRNLTMLESCNGE